MRRNNFGIEIEFTGVHRRILANLLEEKLRMENDSQIYHYSDGETSIDYKLKDKDGLVWVLHRDRSIVAECKHIIVSEEDYQVELISPVLTKQTMPLLFDILEIIREEGGTTNRTCGIHIHVDNPWSVEILRNMILKFGANQEEIMKSFRVNAIRKDSYCKLLPEGFLNHIRKTSYSTVQDLQEDCLNMLSDGIQECGDICHQSRYYSLNLHSLIHTNTVEFRFFNSSLSEIKVRNIIDWVLGFIEVAYDDYAFI